MDGVWRSETDLPAFYQDMKFRVQSLEAQVTTAATTKYTVSDKVYQVANEGGFMGDLEKAVEVAMQPVLDEKKRNLGLLHRNSS